MVQFPISAGEKAKSFPNKKFPFVCFGVSERQYCCQGLARSAGGCDCSGGRYLWHGNIGRYVSI